MPLEKALEQLLSNVNCIDECHTVELEDALDGILAQDVLSLIDVPAYDNSAMDGYAIRSSDGYTGKKLLMVGKSFAGTPYNGEVLPGQCIRIMTGAPIPSDCDSVIMQENCHIEDNTIIINQDTETGSNIRLAANDIEKDQVVLHSGRRLSPTDIGLLASIGRARVQIIRPLKIGLFSTGDELRLPKQSLDPACIYDSNRYVIAAALKRLNMDVLNLGIIPDDPDALRRAFLRCQDECHAIISSGGVSVGEADYTKDILDELGNIQFWKLAIKPGKPFAFGKINQVPFFGLPGNPSSATITFHQLALPALLKMAGETPQTPLSLCLESSMDINKKAGRTDFQRAYLSQENGSYLLDSSIDQSSGMLSSMSRSNCYIKLESERENVRKGEKINVIPFDRWLQ